MITGHQEANWTINQNFMPNPMDIILTKMCQMCHDNTRVHEICTPSHKYCAACLPINQLANQFTIFIMFVKNIIFFISQKLLIS